MNIFLNANEIVLRMIKENEELLDGLDTLIDQFKAGGMRSVAEPVDRSITRMERNVAHVKETVRELRAQLRI